MSAYVNGFKVTIVDFYESYNMNGICCRYASCYIPDLDAVEGILLSDIELK